MDETKNIHNIKITFDSMMEYKSLFLCTLTGELSSSFNRADTSCPRFGLISK